MQSHVALSGWWRPAPSAIASCAYRRRCAATLPQRLASVIARLKYRPMSYSFVVPIAP